MSLKNTFGEAMQDTKKMIDILYVSSKTIFLILAFLFFAVYFSISARFYDQYTLGAFLPLYVCFILSFCQYLALFFWKYFYSKLPFVILVGITIMCFVLAGILLFPLF